jgi:hypothetical protein
VCVLYQCILSQTRWSDHYPCLFWVSHAVSISCFYLKTHLFGVSRALSMKCNILWFLIKFAFVFSVSLIGASPNCAYKVIVQCTWWLNKLQLIQFEFNFLRLCINMFPFQFSTQFLDAPFMDGRSICFTIS